jgi:hypothetical protein
VLSKTLKKYTGKYSKPAPHLEVSEIWSQLCKEGEGLAQKTVQRLVSEDKATLKTLKSDTIDSILDSKFVGLTKSHSGVKVDVRDPASLLTFMKAIYSGKVEPTPLLSTFGAKFPLENRTVTEVVLWDWLTAHYASHKFGKKDRNYHPLPLISGAPGIGKTAVLQAALQLMKNEAKRRGQTKWKELESLTDAAVNVTVTFSNGASVSHDVRNGPEACLALRVLYRYFVEGGLPFGSFLTQIGDVSGLTLYNTLACIKADRVSKGQTGDLLIYVGIDEFGKVLGLSVANAPPHGPNEFLKRLVLAAGTCLCDPPPGVIFVTMFAGTCMEPISKIIRDSSHPSCNVPLPMLEYINALAIVESLKWPPTWKTCAPFLRCLSDNSRWGRAVEVFLEVVDRQIIAAPTFDFNSLDYLSIMEKTRSRLTERYQLSSFGPYLKDIVAAIFLQKLVSHQIPLTWNDCKWGDLETCGAIALVPVGTSYDQPISRHFDDGVIEEKDCVLPTSGTGAGLFMVDLPFTLLRCIMMYTYPDSSPDVLGSVASLLRSADTQNDFWWQSWEDFHANFIAARAQLLVMNNNAHSQHSSCTTTVSQLYRGAYQSKSVQTKPAIVLPRTLKVVNVLQRYPDTTTTPHDVDSGQPVDCMQGDVVVKNGKGGPFDVFAAWVMGDTNLVVCDQLKKLESGTSGSTITAAMLIDELKKTKDALHAAGLMNFTFGLFSDKPYDGEPTDNNLPDGCILVCRQNFRKFYGSIFADRAAFAASRSLVNVNSAPWHLLQLLAGIGPARARNIIEQRCKGHFTSFDDLRARVAGVPASLKDVVDFQSG